MSKLEITYNHKKEQFVANEYGNELIKQERKILDVSQPAPKERREPSIDRLTKVWKAKEEEFIKNLNRFYDCEFNLEGWTAYLVRFPICPYSIEEKWFALSFNPVSEQLTAIGHELFHQPFHLFWEEKCKDIFRSIRNSKNAGQNLVVRSLKEALPELLNTPEFNLSEAEDKGHLQPGEQFIRHLIRQYYKKNGPFTFKQFLTSIS